MEQSILCMCVLFSVPICIFINSSCCSTFTCAFTELWVWRSCVRICLSWMLQWVCFTGVFRAGSSVRRQQKSSRSVRLYIICKHIGLDVTCHVSVTKWLSKHSSICLSVRLSAGSSGACVFKSHMLSHQQHLNYTKWILERGGLKNSH